MTRRLVVTADDAGMDPARDGAILAAFDRGLVRAASCVANGPTIEAFLAGAASRPGLSLGLHLNLTEGTPLAAGRAFTLTEKRGRFLGDKREVWRRAVAGEIDALEVERETTAQWRRLRALGVQPDHVNGHHHVHVLPHVSEGVVRALEAIGRPVFVRVPREAAPPAGFPPVEEPALPLGTALLSGPRVSLLRAGHGGLVALAVHAERLRGSLGRRLRAPDGFFGVAWCTAPSRDLFLHGLTSRPDGIVEAMVHPGRMGSRTTGMWADPRRDLELAVLLDPETRAAVEATGTVLASYAELLA